MTVFGGEVIGDDFKLLNSIDRGDNRDAVAADGPIGRKGVVVDPVERDIGLGKATTAGNERQVGSRSGRSGDGRSIANQLPQREGIAPVERQIQDFIVVDYLPERGRDLI